MWESRLLDGVIGGSLAVVAIIVTSVLAGEGPSLGVQGGTAASQKVAIGEVRVREPRAPAFQSLAGIDEKHFALFALRGRVCPSTINEVFEYNRMLDSIKTDVPITAGALLIGRDSVRIARRFDLMGLDLRSLSFRGGNIADSLAMLNGEPLSAELVFLRLRDSTLTYRVPLLNVSVPRQYKDYVLERAIASLE